MKAKIVYAIAFACLVVILIMPMITHNAIVQTIEASSDMRIHLAMITGQQAETSYFGQTIVRALLSEFDNVSQAYLWFNFIALIGVAGTMFYVTRELISREASYFVIPFALFGATGILALFQYGVIFNIINMYIVLPFAVLFTIRWLTGGKLYNAGIGLVLFALFSVGHYTALYLPYFIYVAVGGYIIYAIVKKKAFTLKKVIPYGGVALGLNLFLSKMFLRPSNELIGMEVNDSFVAGTDVGMVIKNGIQTLPIVFQHISLVLIPIVIALVIWVIRKRNNLEIAQSAKILLCMVAGAVIALGGGLFLHIISNYSRLAIDMTTLTAVLLAGLVGIFLEYRQSKFMTGLVTFLAVVVSVPNVITWVRW